jgi:hypothetical protein
MTIARLGWGSLIWEPRNLPIVEPWREDGPHLPIEYARQSRNGRITLVALASGPPVTTLWCPLRVTRTEDAVEALREREDTVCRHVGVWVRDAACRFPHGDTIGQWAMTDCAGLLRSGLD